MPEFIPQSTQQMAEAKKHHKFSRENGYEAVPYQYRTYPKYLYNTSGGEKLVNSAQEERECAKDGWSDKRPKG